MAEGMLVLFRNYSEITVCCLYVLGVSCDVGADFHPGAVIQELSWQRARKSYRLFTT